MGGGGGNVVKQVAIGAAVGAATGGIGFGLGLTSGAAVFGLEAGLMSAIASGAAMGALGGALSGAAGSLMGGPGGIEDAPALAYEARDRTISVSQPIAPWRVIYGRARVGGVRTFVHTTDNNQKLHVVYTLACHECQSMDEFWLADEIVAVAADGSVSGRWAGKCRVFFGSGSTAGDAAFNAALTASVGAKWTADHRQTGHAKAYVEFTYDSDLFAGGIPNASFVLRGAKIHDPRTGATVWTDNPKLCQRDYMTTWWGWRAAEIDDASIIAGANVCEEMVALAAGNSQTFTTAAGTDLVSLAAAMPGLRIGDGVRVSTTGTLPAGLAAGTTYYWAAASATAGRLATTIANARAGIAIDIADAGTGAHTLTRHSEPRYTCNGTIDLSVEHGQIMTRLLSSDRGRAINSGGAWRFLSGAWQVPSVTLTEDDLDGPISVSPRLPRRDLFNGVKGVYADPDANWQPQDFPAIASDFYMTEDGGRQTTFTAAAATDLLTLADGQAAETGLPVQLRSSGVLPAPLASTTVYYVIAVSAGTIKLAASQAGAEAGTAIDLTDTGSGVHTIQFGERLWKDVDLPFTTSPTMCQRLAKIDLLACRQQVSASLSCKLTAMRIRAGDVERISNTRFGWSAKAFEVAEWEFSTRQGSAPHFGINLALRETDESVYDWATSEEQTVDPAADSNLPDPFTVAPPTALSLSSGTADLLLAGDGTVFSRVRASWTAPADAFVGQVEVQFKRSVDSTWLDAPPVRADITEAFIAPVDDGTAYDVRVRSVNTIGVRSAWATITGHVVVGKTAAPDAVTGFSAQQNGATVTFRCAASTEADNSRIEVRRLTAGIITWADGEVVGNILRGYSYTTAAVPPGSWTFLAKAIDTSGNESASSARFDLTIANANTVIFSTEQAPDWLGAKTNFVKHWTGVLLPASTMLASEHTKAELFEAFVPYPEATCTYEAVNAAGSADFDVSFDSDDCRVWASITAALGPGATGVADPRLMVDYRLAAGSYDGFEDWTVGEINGRYVKCRAVIETGTGAAYLSAFAPTADEALDVQSGTVTAAIGGTAVVFPRRYHAAPQMQVTAEAVAGAARIATYESVNATGAIIRVFDAAGNDAGGGATWTSSGV